VSWTVGWTVDWLWVGLWAFRNDDSDGVLGAWLVVSFIIAGSMEWMNLDWKGLGLEFLVEIPSIQSFALIIMETLEVRHDIRKESNIH
jgi:hypothetical protein